MIFSEGLTRLVQANVLCDYRRWWEHFYKRMAKRVYGNMSRICWTGKQTRNEKMKLACPTLSVKYIFIESQKTWWSNPKFSHLTNVDGCRSS